MFSHVAVKMTRYVVSRGREEARRNNRINERRFKTFIVEANVYFEILHCVTHRQKI